MNKDQDMVLSSASLLCFVFVFVFFFVAGGGGGMVVKVIPLRLTDKKKTNSVKKTAKLTCLSEMLHTLLLTHGGCRGEPETSAQ